MQKDSLEKLVSIGKASSVSLYIVDKKQQGTYKHAYSFYENCEKYTDVLESYIEGIGLELRAMRGSLKEQGTNKEDYNNIVKDLRKHFISCFDQCIIDDYLTDEQI